MKKTFSLNSSFTLMILYSFTIHFLFLTIFKFTLHTDITTFKPYLTSLGAIISRDEFVSLDNYSNNNLSLQLIKSSLPQIPTLNNGSKKQTLSKPPFKSEGSLNKTTSKTTFIFQNSTKNNPKNIVIPNDDEVAPYSPLQLP